jgi:hypothetical protein
MSIYIDTKIMLHANCKCKCILMIDNDVEMNGCRILLFPRTFSLLVRHTDNLALPGISEKPVQASEPESVSASDEKGHLVCVVSAVWIVCH